MDVASTRKMSRVVITAVLVLTTALCELILCVLVLHCCFSEKKLFAPVAVMFCLSFFSRVFESASYPLKSFVLSLGFSVNK